LFGTSLALLNFGIDEFINPRLRAAGLTGRQARRAGMPRHPRLGLTPVIASAGRNGSGTSQGGSGQDGSGSGESLMVGGPR